MMPDYMYCIFTILSIFPASTLDVSAMPKLTKLTKEVVDQAREQRTHKHSYGKVILTCV